LREGIDLSKWDMIANMRLVWTCLIVTIWERLAPSSCSSISHPIFMDSASSSNAIVKKQEDEEKDDKRDIKPVPKTLNRVPRKLTNDLSTEFSFLLSP
jgi:hypothetical protein